jgi:hypothetical protein
MNILILIFVVTVVELIPCNHTLNVIEEFYFDQRLDHYDFKNLKTWKQVK